MTRTIYWTATSLDGFIADDDHGLDWLFEVPRADDHPDLFTPFFERIGAVVMGSSTFEWVVAHERMREVPERWDAAFGGRPCWVFTSRERDPIPGTDLAFVAGDVVDVHARMVQAAGGGDIWVAGGGDLAGQFADAGLLDEVHLGIQPVFLGSGAPLLPRRLTSERVALASVERVGQELHAVYTLA